MTPTEAKADNEEAALREVSPSLGVITVKIWRVKIRGELDPESRDYALSRSRLDTAPIHESKKKMGGHRIAFVLFCYLNVIVYHLTAWEKW